MQAFTDTILSKFDNVVRHFSPVNTLIDKVVSRVAPTVEAKACGGTPCGSYELVCGDGCQGGFGHFFEKYAGDGHCGGPYTYWCQLAGCVGLC